MAKYYGIDTLHTRRYVLQDLDNVSNPMQATIRASKNMIKQHINQCAYRYESNVQFIKKSFQEISVVDIIYTWHTKDVFYQDAVINKQGLEPSLPTDRKIDDCKGYPDKPGVKYYAILAKHRRRYVVRLEDDVCNELDAAINIIKIAEHNGSLEIMFICGHKSSKIEFIAESFAKIPIDDISKDMLLRPLRRIFWYKP